MNSNIESAAVAVNCPACDQKIELPEAMLHEAVSCPTCDRQFVPEEIRRIQVAPRSPARPQELDALKAIANSADMATFGRMCIWIGVIIPVIYLLFYDFLFETTGPETHFPKLMSALFGLGFIIVGALLMLLHRLDRLALKK